MCADLTLNPATHEVYRGERPIELTQREFELLSRLFGDPDAYHGGLHQLGAPQERGDLRARVQDILNQLG